MIGKLVLEKTLNSPHVCGRITAYAFLLDEGANILITGGTRTHVGAFSHAEPGRETETRQFPGHRDGVVSARWAEVLCRLLDGPVSVECGIHFDGLSGEGIREVVKACGEMLEELCGCWTPLL